MADEEIGQLRGMLEESYKQAALGRLMAGVVHEINTPIASILSNNEVIRKTIEILTRELGPGITPRATKLLASLTALSDVDRIACERISGVVRGLKTCARGGDGSFRLVRLNEILEDAIRLANTEFKRRITVERHYGEIPEVECDAQAMSQVFLNLMVNAGQAIDGEGKITVTTAVDSGSAVISIADTGSGIRKEDRDKIFGAGFSTKPMGQGTGLGLNLSRRIVVEQHNGSVTFDSVPGEGTTFYVRIPLSRVMEGVS